MARNRHLPDHNACAPQAGPLNGLFGLFRRLRIFGSSFHSILILVIMLFATIPVVIMFSVSGYYVRRYAQQTVAEASLEKLNVLSASTQNAIDSLNTSIYQFCLSDTVRSIATASRYSDLFTRASYMIDINTTRLMLENIVQINGMSDKASLFISQADYLVTSDAGLEKLRNVDSIPWYEYVRTYMSQQARLPSSDKGQDYQIHFHAASRRFYYIHRYSMQFPDVLLTVVAEIPESALSQYLNQSRSHYSETVLTTDSSQITSHPDKSLIGMPLDGMEGLTGVIQSSVPAGYAFRTIGGEPKVITYTYNANNGWYIIDIASPRLILDNVSGLINKMILITIALLAVSVAISWLVSNRIYHPIRTFMHSLSAIQGVSLHGSLNEIDSISQAFSELSDRKESLEQFYNSHIMDVQARYIRSFLTGSQASQDEADRQIIAFERPVFMVACMYIDRYKSFSERFEQHEQFYLQNLIVNTAQEAFAAVGQAWGIVFDRKRLALLINTGAGQTDEALLDQITALCLELQSKVQQTAGLSLSIGLSRTAQSAAELANLFNQANEALRRKFVLGYGQIHHYSNGHPVAAHDYPKKEEDLLINCLKNASPDTIEAIGNFFNALCNRQKYDIQLIYLHVQQLLARLYAFMVEESIPIDNIEDLDISTMWETGRFENIGELKPWLEEFCQKILDCRQNSLSGSNAHYMRILAFVKDNYVRDIDLTAVADGVGLSYSYVRQVFRNNSSLSITDYVTMLRINKACDMLLTTDKTVREIACAVGYNNTQSFNRAFRKQEGVNPREYKDINQHKQDI